LLEFLCPASFMGAEWVNAMENVSKGKLT